jgi:GNAT superfamily N-acetyltransferase
MARRRSKVKSTLRHKITANVAGRFYCDRGMQWRGIGFESMEDAEEWQTDMDIKIENLITRQGV